jgi:hypothetical protein
VCGKTKLSCCAQPYIYIRRQLLRRLRLRTTTEFSRCRFGRRELKNKNKGGTTLITLEKTAPTASDPPEKKNERQTAPAITESIPCNVTAKDAYRKIRTPPPRQSEVS